MNNDPWSDVRSSSINEDIESAITSLSNSNANNNSFLLSNHRKNSIHSDVQKPLSINEELNKEQPSPILRRTTLSLGGYSLQNGNQSYKGNYNFSSNNPNDTQGYVGYNQDKITSNQGFAHQFNTHNSVNYPLNINITTNSGQTNMTSNYVNNRRGSYTMSKNNLNLQNNSILMNQAPKEASNTGFFENFGKQLVEATKEVEQNDEPVNTNRLSFSESEGRSHSIRDTLNSLNPPENAFNNMGWMNQNSNGSAQGFVPQFQGFYNGPPMPPNFMMPFMNNSFMHPPANNSSGEQNDENVEIQTPAPNMAHGQPPLSPPTGVPMASAMGGTPIFVPMSLMNTPISSPPVNSSQHVSSNSKSKRQGKQNKFNKRKEPVIRSEKLEHFIRTYKEYNYQLEDVLGDALEFCKDQVGSRFIQEVIPKTNDEVIIKFYNEINDHVYQLMVDVFGNYVIQKLLETVHNEDISSKIMEHIKGNVETLTKSQYGCRIIQKALCNLSLEHKMIIANELKHTDIKECINDQNGNHVIQKAIENIPMEKIMFIVDQLRNSTSKYATHSYGCRVIQRLLEYGDDSTRENILTELKPCFSQLIKNEFGNYVIQYILKSSNENSKTLEDSKTHIIELVQDNVLDFSCHKYASNVVEQIFVLGNDSQKKTMYSLILPKNVKDATDLSEDELIYLMMKDQYANYVIQKMVKLSENGSKNQELLVLAIRSYLEKLKKNQQGQQTYANQRKNKTLASVDKLGSLIQNIKI